MIAAMAGILVIALIVLAAVLSGAFDGREKQRKQRPGRTRRVFVKTGVNIKKQMLGDEKGEYFTGKQDEEGTRLSNSSVRMWRIVFDNLYTGERIYMDFSGRMQIGRREPGQCPRGKLAVSGDNKISRNHCIIYEAAGKLYLQDLQSRNHTYLNGQQVVGSVCLKNGDVIRVGRTQLKVQYNLAGVVLAH